jgi:hypothetical protein
VRLVGAAAGVWAKTGLTQSSKTNPPERYFMVVMVSETTSQ